ncbi:MAG: hypothetical protein JSW61_00035 [Candidatus Thorarchaeota archaeon]|nr:MAG: hypothetical protein JSW61_00035 [Candidatus Thorarchaeota archaeon]
MRRPHWLTMLAALACVALSVTALFMYPLSGYDLLAAAAYQVSVFVGVFILLHLIDSKARPQPH